MWTTTAKQTLAGQRQAKRKQQKWQPTEVRNSVSQVHVFGKFMLKMDKIKPNKELVVHEHRKTPKYWCQCLSGLRFPLFVLCSFWRNDNPPVTDVFANNDNVITAFPVAFFCPLRKAKGEWTTMAMTRASKKKLCNSIRRWNSCCRYWDSLNETNGMEYFFNIFPQMATACGGN
jgi:hypothetical protein